MTHCNISIWTYSTVCILLVLFFRMEESWSTILYCSNYYSTIALEGMLCYCSYVYRCCSARKWEVDFFLFLALHKENKMQVILQYSIIEYSSQASLHLDLQGWNTITHQAFWFHKQILGTGNTGQYFGVYCNFIFPFEFIFCSILEVKYI